MPDQPIPPPVTIDQAIEVLKIASAYDGRHPSVLQAQVWAADLADARVAAGEAGQGVRDYYRDNPDGYIKPGHVIRAARAARQERADADRRAIAATPREGTLDPAFAAAEIRKAIAAALATRVAREATESAGDPPAGMRASYHTPRSADGGINAADMPRYSREVMTATNLDRPVTGSFTARCSDTATEPDGTPCPGVLTFGPSDPQARCPVCGGWTGRNAPGVVVLGE